MKKSYFLLSLLLSMACTTYATIWRVNNDTAIDADYRTIQAAIDDDDNVLSGDTLHIEGTIYAYASFTLDKKLVIIGTGYFLTENPNTYVNKSATMSDGSCSFIAGSDSSTVMGMTLGSFQVSNGVNKITLMKNKISGYIQQNGGSSSSHIFIQNFVQYIAGIFYNSIIENNIILESVSQCDGCTIRNNIINADWATGGGVNTQISSCTGSYFTNNIVGGSQASNTVCEFTNNIFLGATASTDADNNKYITSLLPVFSTSGTTDGKYKLSTNSAAKGAADDGGDCGIFYNNNGGSIYVLSGLPQIPNVYAIKNTSAVTDSELKLRITIGSRTE